ncbi:MAG: threonylcarbamoyl-AMP synthase [Firmicutes bacterium]|nr:threonylcarbamoyl-AMP synthase [Bacillota bacterium]
MKTTILTVDPKDTKLNNEIYAKAAEVINTGGLVAFPTETVYGLGANALDGTAVKKIYKAKGRPSDNPLIAHISAIEQLYALVRDISPAAQRLMKAFWPGPMTLVFKKKDIIPSETSGGLDTVAIRYPENKTAQDFITACGVPIAAPSANTSGKPSPTRASHVEYDLDGKIDMIIDGGSCEFGLESTIVDVSGLTPCLLRPGSVTLEMLREIVPDITVDKAVLGRLNEGERPKAPGMKYTHYSPDASVTIVRGSTEKTVCEINRLLEEHGAEKCGVIATEETKDGYNTENVLVIGSRRHPETIAANLFKMLRKCDYYGYKLVFVEGFPESEIGLAIMNRLKKAAGYNIIELD